MRMFSVITAAAALLAHSGSNAQTAVAPKRVTAGDVVTKPLSDLNINKDEIPEILLAAQEQPYSLAGMKTCKAVQLEVSRLNDVLGDDIDIVEEKSRGEKRGNTVGNIAKSIMGTLIPFGGVIREISGANASERQLQLAIFAGSARRSYLKGYGQQRGCRYPARAASSNDVAVLQKARLADEQQRKANDEKSKGGSGKPTTEKKNDKIRFESKPIVQRTNPGR